MGTVDPTPQGEVMAMQEMWDDVESRFEKLAGKPLRSKGTTSLDDCKAQIAKLQRPADADTAPAKRSGTAKTKSFAMDMLHCVKLLGGVAAQGASIVFPPSRLCFNAISLLLDIPADLQKFHAARFTELEPDLIQGTHRLMISFVNICALSIKLREARTWETFKVEAKLILLQKDSDVGKEIANFHDLLAAHSVQQGAQQLLALIYNKDVVTEVPYQASESGKRVNEILDSTDRVKNEETVRANLATIKDKLGLKDGIDKASQDIRDKFWHDRLDETAHWIDTPSEHGEFHSWAERKDANAKALFTLTGDSNTGKSVIVSSIVYHLRSKYESAARKLEQTIVASYFFPSLAGKNDSDEQPVQTAMKAIALQIATAKTAYYLVFDGLANLPSDYHEDQMELLGLLGKLGTASRAVRAVVSLRPDMTDPGFDEATRWNLGVEEDGKQDICFYIDESLKKDDILQDDDEYRTEMRIKIRDRLSGDLGGNYYKKIKTIVRTTGKGADIDKVLDESNEDEKAISLKAISKLEESLEVEEIEELNELLIWIGYARGGPLSFERLDAALFLRFKTPSMLKLEKKLLVSGGTAGIDSDMLALIYKDRTVPRGEEETKFSVNINITKANLTSVQRFLWNLTMKVKLEDKTAANGFDSYLTILKRTFQLLGEAPNKDTKAIAPYLLNYLPQHLNELKEAPTLHPLTPLEKQTIGEGLYALFATGDVVKTHWESCNELIWCRTEDELDTFLTWFKDPDITSKLGEVASSSNPHRALLQNIMGDGGCGPTERHRMGSLSFIQLDSVFPGAGMFTVSVKIDELRKEHADNSVEFVTAWCQHVLRVKEPDSLWNERVAEVYFETNDYRQAIKRFRAASERENPTPGSLEGLANSLAGEDSWKEASQTMVKALGLLDSVDPLNKTRLVADYMQLSEWYYKLHDLPKTVEYLQKALSLVPDDHEARYRLLCAWLDSEDASEEATNLLHELAGSALGQDKPSQFGKIIDKMVDEDDRDARFGQLFAVVSVEARLSRRTMQELDHVIERAKEGDESLEHATLLFYKGLATYHYSIMDTVPNKAPFESTWDGALGWRIWMTDVVNRASSFIASHHFEQAMDPGSSAAARSKHVDALKAIADKEQSAELSPAMSYLAYYYTAANEPIKTRDIVRACITSAFEILSDADDENDTEGYYYLSSVLMQCGDLVNAQSAMSLLLPPPVETNVLAWILDFDTVPEKAIAADLMARVDREASLAAADLRTRVGAREESDRVAARVRSFSRLKSVLAENFKCDGSCGAPSNLEVQAAMHFCRCCLNLSFCAELRLPLRSLACSAQHNYLEALRGNVCVGGEIADDGTRVGAEFRPIATWLDGLKAEWGYVEKPKTPEEEEEEEAAAEGGAEDAGKEAAATEASADEALAAVAAVTTALQAN
ncbi:nacht and tpr domain-containing protein [Apodospora peruviana]|uniref:Nacht and tpr domain-containing protein n=1 Tax=Apodospora peruviana TaxID=516989 RepID=A0AAE0I6L5_9PEZI|nr:nacht and tpr domain-containing protein [Apodospora peruviana]